jgi:maleylpyruvate isomerase
MRVVLHNYFRSSTSVRVRIALNLKGISFDYVAHRLPAGAHRQPAYLELNPAGLVPTLEWPGIPPLGQSLAILEYLDETVPAPPLLPTDPAGRARVRSLAHMIACDIHPLNNLRVLNALRDRFGADDAAVAAWFRHWVEAMFPAIETRLATEPDTADFAHGATPGIADICLVAQVVNNARFDVDMRPYPTIERITQRCMALESFARAMPAVQADAL